jgi:hypothetical protein
MKRFFNTTGLCEPEDHYMVEPFRGMFDDICQMIEASRYFSISGPGRSGKSTFLQQLLRTLNRERKYCACLVSLDLELQQEITVEKVNQFIINSIYKASSLFLAESECPEDPISYKNSPLPLKQYLRAWSVATDRPLVILLDDFDLLPGDALTSVLSQIRDGFQMRPQRFPKCIVLAGQSDISKDSYRQKQEVCRSEGGHVPFNVKAESFFLPVFSREEVRGLLSQHTEDTGQEFSDAVFEKIYEYADGAVSKVQSEKLKQNILYEEINSPRGNSFTTAFVASWQN